jgi:hypothetical protein
MRRVRMVGPAKRPGGVTALTDTTSVRGPRAAVTPTIVTFGRDIRP